MRIDQPQLSSSLLDVVFTVSSARETTPPVLGAPVYLAAVMEYLATEVLELAGKSSHDNKKPGWSPHQLSLLLPSFSHLEPGFHPDYTIVYSHENEINY